MALKIPMNGLVRALLRFWVRLDVAPGYCYRVIEELASDTPVFKTVTLPGGCRINLNLAEHVDRHIYFWGAYEPVESFLFHSLIAPGMTVVDAGANIGQYTLLSAQAVGPGGRVLSFEPSARTFAKLKENVELNRFENVRLFPAALWDAEGKLGFRLPEPNNSGTFRYSKTGEVEVDAVPLGKVIGTSRVDLIKMDVEGAEARVLRGAEALIRKYRPIILMEINRRALEENGVDPEALLGMLKDLGYKMWRMGSSAEDSYDVESFDQIQQENVIAHCGNLPEAVSRGWTERSARRWARGAWRVPSLLVRD